VYSIMGDTPKATSENPGNAGLRGPEASQGPAPGYHRRAG